MRAPDLTAAMRVEAEMCAPIATASLTRFNLPSLDHTVVDNDCDWVDLCLTPRPRNTRARFRDRWGPHRFEKLGPLFLMPRGETIQFRTDGGPQLSIVCRFRDEPLRDWLQESVWTEQRLEAGLDIANETVRLGVGASSRDRRASGTLALTGGRPDLN